MGLMTRPAAVLLAKKMEALVYMVGIIEGEKRVVMGIVRSSLCNFGKCRDLGELRALNCDG